VLPAAGDPAASQTANAQPLGVVLAKRNQAWRGTAVVCGTAAIGLVKEDPLIEEQNRGGVVPARFEPFCLDARVKQRNAIPVLSELRNPIANHAAVEGRIEPHAPVPGDRQTVLSEGTGSAIPRPDDGAGRVQIVWASRVDNLDGGDPILRIADAPLMTA
jgi:hypothetical protein